MMRVVPYRTLTMRRALTCGIAVAVLLALSPATFARDMPQYGDGWHRDWHDRWRNRDDRRLGYDEFPRFDYVEPLYPYFYGAEPIYPDAQPPADVDPPPFRSPSADPPPFSPWVDPPPFLSPAQ